MTIRATLALVFAALSACTTVTPIATRPEYHPNRLVGTWDVRDSAAQFLISQRRSDYVISGISTSGGEHFRIIDVRWDGRYLNGTFFMPGTHWTTYSHLKFTGPDRLEGRYRGDSKTGTEVWLRKRPTKTSNQALQPTAGRRVVSL